MTRNMSDTAERISRLDERSADTSHGELKYSFFEMVVSGETYYATEVIGGGESSLAVIGKDYTNAYELYCALARLKVTPCTLQEIVSDNFMEMKY